MGGGGEQCSTVGYRYFAGLHLIFCHAVDRLLRIRVGEKVAWSGLITGNTSVYIDQPNLFGGEDREGGVRGTVDICFGGPAQGRNSYLQSLLGANIPAYRGLFGLVARKCMLAANNPYIKEWSILAQRTVIGWRDDLAGITAPDGFVDMNPAHIILETLTNTTWGGLGYPLTDIDLASFQTAANLLAAEQFGLSLIWARNTSVEDFLQLILDHIDGALFFSHATGLLTLKLIRNDYNVGAIPALNESNIMELVDFTAPNDTEVVNQVVVNYVDRDNQPGAVTVQDIAGIARMNGQVNVRTLDFVGISNSTLASRVASRELQQLAMPIASVTLVINRIHSALEPGDCFAFNWGPLGVANMVMRVSQVEFDAHADQSIRITGVRDVYGLGAVAFTTPADSLWSAPESQPADAVQIRLAEITWWQFVREYAGDSTSVLAELDDSSTLVTCCCGRPSSDALNYEMWTRNVGAAEWGKKDVDSFPFVSPIDADLVPEIESIITLAAPLDPDLVKVGTYAFLGAADQPNEIVAVLAVGTGANTVTVARGVLDTIPLPHEVGVVIWFCQGFFGLDKEERAVGESVEVRILPSTSLGRLAIEDATTTTIACAGRMMRPYPPGNVRINGSRWPASIGATAELAVTWAHRDRTVQTVTLNRQDEGNIGPEAGVTYTLRIYGETGTLIRTVTGITGTGYIYPSATEIADSGLGRLNTSLRIELESVHGSLVSLYKWDLSVTRV